MAIRTGHPLAIRTGHPLASRLHVACRAHSTKSCECQTTSKRFDEAEDETATVARGHTHRRRQALRWRRYQMKAPTCEEKVAVLRDEARRPPCAPTAEAVACGVCERAQVPTPAAAEAHDGEAPRRGARLYCTATSRLRPQPPPSGCGIWRPPIPGHTASTEAARLLNVFTRPCAASLRGSKQKVRKSTTVPRDRSRGAGLVTQRDAYHPRHIEGEVRVAAAVERAHGRPTRWVERPGAKNPSSDRA